jgi:hypothetical protein
VLFISIYSAILLPPFLSIRPMNKLKNLLKSHGWLLLILVVAAVLRYKDLAVQSL